MYIQLQVSVVSFLHVEHIQGYTRVISGRGEIVECTVFPDVYCTNHSSYSSVLA